MRKSKNSSNVQTNATHGRRDFLSRSLLAGSTLLLAAESQGQTPLSQSDDLAIAKTVTLADSIALYTNLLDDLRRSILQQNVIRIRVAKFEATEWLARTTSHSEELRSMLKEGAVLTDPQKSELRGFLSEVNYGGNEISQGLIRMRQEPLEEIKNLDTDFDKIRAELTTASNAIKNRDPGKAKEGIASAISKLNKYSSKYSPAVISNNNEAPRPQQRQMQQQAQAPIQQQAQMQQQVTQPIPFAPSTLRELLQTVLDLLNATPTSRLSDQHHPRAYARAVNYNSIPVEPALQAGINSVLRTKLNPASWLQVGIGYAVTFPILLRVSDKNNRIKLLNDALRLVPPGLRNPLLAELANDLASLP